MRKRYVFLLVLILCSVLSAFESLKPLSDPMFNGKVPSTLEEGWLGYDPSHPLDSLETEILREWNEDVITASGTSMPATFRVIRFTTGTFKGEKSKMVALYGFPTGGSNLPAILECHGGGQSANMLFVKSTIANGYAMLSLNWGGKEFNIGTQGIWSTHNTEWRGIRADQGITNDHWDGGQSLLPTEYTIDSVVSPRNNNWFVLTLVARRGLTFLEQQPEVDPTKLGMHGFSMGGVITFATTVIDKRIKAAVSQAAVKVDPQGDPATMQGYDMWNSVISAYPQAKRLTTPMILHNGSNDFHGLIDDVDQLEDSLTQLDPRDYRFTREPNKNHQNNPENDINTILWFDMHLKGEFTMPQTPTTKVSLVGNTPTYEVTVDANRSVKEVTVWYALEEKANPTVSTDRVWNNITSTANGSTYSATLPTVDTTTQTMRIFTNVEYHLDKSMKGGWGYTTDFHSLSSTLTVLGLSSSVSTGYSLSLTAVNGAIETSPEQSTYNQGTVVTVRAIPDNGYFFSHWAQNLAGTENPTTITLNSNKGVEAIFSPLGNDTGMVFLSDLSWENAISGVLTVQKDLNVLAQPISINDSIYNKGLGTHAESEITYILGGAYERFLSDVGIDDGANGTVEFIVIADGDTLYRSPVLGTTSPTEMIDVDITGTQVLRLVVSDGGNGNGADHANWGAARVILAEPNSVETVVSQKLNEVALTSVLNGMIQVIADERPSSVYIYDITGRLVASSERSFEVSVSHLTIGRYFTKVNFKNRSFSTSFIRR